MSRTQAQLNKTAGEAANLLQQLFISIMPIPLAFLNLHDDTIGRNSRKGAKGLWNRIWKVVGRDEKVLHNMSLGLERDKEKPRQV
jgi:hypothetical protein